MQQTRAEAQLGAAGLCGAIHAAPCVCASWGVQVAAGGALPCSACPELLSPSAVPCAGVFGLMLEAAGLALPAQAHSSSCTLHEPWLHPQPELQRRDVFNLCWITYDKQPVMAPCTTGRSKPGFPCSACWQEPFLTTGVSVCLGCAGPGQPRCAVLVGLEGLVQFLFVFRAKHRAGRTDSVCPCAGTFVRNAA